MNKINQLKAILEQITSNTVIIGRIKDSPTGMWLSPSNMTGTMSLEEVYFYDVILKEETLELFETKAKQLLRCKTNIDFNYNDFDARGYISVTNGSEFAIDDDIVGTTSNATGTVYMIDINTLYLKDVTGIWQVEAINGKTSNTTTTLIPTIFPFFLHIKKVKEDYDIDGDPKEYWTWVRFEARWTL